MVTTYLGQRKPTEREKKNGAEVVFLREFRDEVLTIYACRCYESWEQWGESYDVLRDNVEEVERWRRSFNDF